MKKKILIIEDDLTFQNLVELGLEKEGFEVLKAQNGEEGLEVALRERPDLILLDIIMPVMDGMTMLAKLRENPWGRSAKVILLSNMSDTGKVKKEHEDYGAYAYITKANVNMNDLLKMILVATKK